MSKRQISIRQISIRQISIGLSVRDRPMRSLLRYACLASFLALVLVETSLAATVEGRVLDPDDRPVADARVTVVGPGDQRATTDTDGEGRFQLGAAENDAVRLIIEADGFARFDQRVAVNDLDTGWTATLELAAVSGQILVSAGLPDLPDLLAARDISGRDIESRGVNDLGAALRGIGGMSSVRRGAINLDPTVRGLQETQVALFVDGSRTFAAGPARMDSGLSHIGPHAISNVRVVKGPYALTWGAGALSAIELETVRADFARGAYDWQASVDLGYAENAERLDGHARVGAGSERFAWNLSAGRRDGDDFEAGDGSLVPGDYESTDTRLDLRFKPDDAWVVALSGGYQEQFDLDYPGRILDATYFYTRSVNAEVSRAGGGFLTSFFGQLYTNRKDHRMNNDEKPTAEPAPGRVPPFGLRVDLPTESNTAGGRARFGVTRGAVDWTLGADTFVVEQTARREVRRRSNDALIFSDIVWPDAEIENVGLYGQAVWRGDRSTLGATLRTDFTSASADAVSDFFEANTVGDTDQSESELSLALSWARELADGVDLRLGLGRTSRTATVLERYSDRFPATKFQLAAEFVGDPLLDPETATELDVGLTIVRGSLRVVAEVYGRQIEDYITVLADPSLPRRLPLSPPVVFRYINGDDATFYGGELRLDQQLRGRSVDVDWWAEASYVRAEDETFDEPALGIEPLTLRAGVRVHTLARRLAFDLGVRVVDRQDRVATVRFEQETPGFTAYDAGVSWSPGQGLARTGWRLQLLVTNLTDRAYAEHLNAPNPFTRQRVLEIGRDVRLGVQLRW